MAENLSSLDVAGVLDQLYRGATGIPRRFFLRSDELMALARRQRGLRREFFKEMARYLEDVHSILVSYPRLAQGGLLAFVGARLMTRWPLARDIDSLLDISAAVSWGEIMRARIIKLMEMKPQQGPLLLTEQQLCRIAARRQFADKWWQQLVEEFVNVPGKERLMFFADTTSQPKFFAAAQESYIGGWFHPVKDHWLMAERRFALHEEDDDDFAPIADQAKVQWRAAMNGARLSTKEGPICPCDRRT